MGMALSMDKKLFLETGGDIILGGYVHTNGFVNFLGDRDDLEETEYFSPEEVAGILESEGVDPSAINPVQPNISVVELDSLLAALEVKQNRSAGEDALPVLVLNFAAAFEAGGGVLVSSKSQESELIRRTTLYASLTSEEARPYYDDNRELGGALYTDGLLLSPHVEVFRRIDNITMDAPEVIAVVSMSAPFARSIKGMGPEELQAVLANRIAGMLKLAYAKGYRDLVLGAWGCGTNQNDPVLIARAFRDALEAPIGDTKLAALFDSITFAITDGVAGQPNLSAFCSQFAE